MLTCSGGSSSSEVHLCGCFAVFFTDVLMEWQGAKSLIFWQYRRWDKLTAPVTINRCAQPLSCKNESHVIVFRTESAAIAKRTLVIIPQPGCVLAPYTPPLLVRSPLRNSVHCVLFLPYCPFRHSTMVYSSGTFKM